MELSQFKINPYHFMNQETKFPTFEYPNCIGYYSRNGNGDVTPDFSQLKYLTVPQKVQNLHMDLNKGLSQVIRKSIKDLGLHDLLLWIMDKKGKIDRSVTDFVCYRGLLRLIMTTPYDSEEWEIMACCVNDVIYLCGRDTDQQKMEKLNRTEKQMRFMSWGFKFEQFLLADNPGAIPDTSQPVDEREEFNCVFTTLLDNTRLLYGAEMDGIESEESIDESDLNCLKKAKFVEVKTNRLIQSRGQRHTFERYKLIRWWCQSYLAGVHKIICGFRDDNGIVREIDVFETQLLHHLAKGKWNPNICMNFCKEFLQFVRLVVESEKEKNANVVWRFIWRPQQPVKVVREKDNEDFAVLPDWYRKSQSQD